jgi:hypothetical protein
MNHQAPILIFCFNRPNHIRFLLQSLFLNVEFATSKVFVFCDGPKPISDKKELENIDLTKKIVKNLLQDINYELIERDQNMGLGQSVRSGVDFVFEHYQSVIVLEDDLVVSSGFLKFMNYYLKVLQNAQNVWHISGFQRDSWLQTFVPEVFYTGFMNCSGWATWKSKWNRIVWDYDFWNEKLLDRRFVNKVDYQGFLNIAEQVHLNKTYFRTWAVFWYLTINWNKGICLNPRYSFVQNNGDDGTGVNMGKTDINKITFLANNFSGRVPIVHSERYIGHWFVRESYAKGSNLSNRKIKTFFKAICVGVLKFAICVKLNSRLTHFV